ncbi:MAG: hypothetical protein JXD18_07770 [Anaerolineae bacterium]|nr:hypothetical protein [Anaerolineae bacterium]
MGQLSLINAVLTSAIVILSFALLIYILLYNFRSDVARAFCAMLACVLIVYFTDLIIAGAQPDVATHWLRFQWLGIAFTPAAYLQFSDALLGTTNDRSKTRSRAIHVAYALSAATLALAVTTDLLVYDGFREAGTFHLKTGPYFWPFLIYFALAVGWGSLNVYRARRRCLTSTSRRRMTYLSLSFLAPAAGVFPYLLIAGWPNEFPGAGLWALLVVGNLAVGLMLSILAYTVAFFGALTPDRVVKHRFVRYLLRGPIQATVVVAVVVLAARSDNFLGLPPLRLTLFGVVISILLVQLGIELAKPLIDRLLYRRDKTEIAWIQDLSNRLLTTTDLHQFLENVLTAVCDLLRVPTAFVAVIEGNQPHLEAVCGSLESDPGFLPRGTLRGIVAGNPPRHLQQHDYFFVWENYWLVPLCSGTDDVIGVLGIAARTPFPDLSEDEEEGLHKLVSQAEVALEDQRIQQSLFAALEHMMPQIEDIQHRRSYLRYEGDAALRDLTNMLDAPDFSRWVRDALSHYWGGPKLTSSPLLNLRLVEQASAEHGSTVNALRAVLQGAIERLRPTGNRSMTAAEWLLYNILDMKFIRGYKVRDIAIRLAMSESDLYRKQRLAIEEVARVLAEMERQEQQNGADV